MNNNRLRSVAAAVTAAVGCGLGTTAWADSYHYNNILIGDRASGMGGAYTAVADDPAGLFYNPAGTVYAGGRNISASVNAYHTTSITYSDVLGGGDWSRESSALLPNFFGVVQPLGKGVIGFSYAVTDSIVENQDQLLTNVGTLSEFLININNEDNTYKIGPSYAQEIRDGLSIGATLYLHMRNSETIVNQIATRTDGSYAWQNSYTQSDELGYEPVLGIMWSPMDQLSIGLTLRQTMLLNSDIDSQVSCVSDLAICSGGVASLTPTSVLGSTDEERTYPLTTAIGVAYFPSDRLLLSADFTYYNEADGLISENQDNLFRTKLATWNLSLGMEYYYNSTYAVRAGFFTNRANTPSLESGLANQPQHIDLNGFSLTLSRFTRSSSITGGFGYSFGSGEAQVIADTTNIQDATASTLTVFLSTSYTY